MPVWARPVHPTLRPMVASWVGYDYRTEPHALHHGAPSTALTVVLSMDEPVDCGWLAGMGSAHYHTLVAGLHHSPAVIRTHGRQHGLHLALSPMGSRALLGVPAGTLAGHIVDTREFGWSESFLDQLRHAPWERRFELLQDHLLERLPAVSDLPRPEVRHAWNVIRASHGSVAIEQIASLVGFSRRHLLNLLRDEIGLTPKQISRIARFEHARHLWGSGHLLADVAQMAGYSDQAHLTRDWKALAGLTPTTTPGDFPNVQDGPRVRA